VLNELLLAFKVNKLSMVATDGGGWRWSSTRLKFRRWRNGDDSADEGVSELMAFWATRAT
jgi:hypothetical protein